MQRALPHATQVADRYHLVQNLREHLQRFPDRKRTWLPEVENIPLQGGSTSTPALLGSLNEQAGSSTSPGAEGSVSAESSALAPEQEQSTVPPALLGHEVELAALSYAERKKKISRGKRSVRYEYVLALHRGGLGQRAIARELRMSQRTVQRFLTPEGFPKRAPSTGVRPKGKSKLDLYREYLRARWNAGEHSGSRLFAEIKQRGYTGSASLLRHLLGDWRTELPPKPRQGHPRKQRLTPKPKKRRLSSHGASFLMILAPSKRTQTQQQRVEQMILNEDLRTVYLLSQEFVTLLNERQVEALDSWLERAKACHVTELTSFVNGIRRDYAAVRTACSPQWSNGTTEGQINRLKFLKRQMFGHAQLDLLRLKVLHAS